jgi:hypothetical protein
MSEPEDYCELCDLPRSQCIHGQPPPPEKKAVKKTAPAPARPRTQAARSVAPPKVVTRRWTPPEVFKPLILDLLEQAGGELQAEDVFQELEVLVKEDLRPQDSETTPEGELRWRYAARRARVALIDEGRMPKAGPGVWKLA